MYNYMEITFCYYGINITTKIFIYFLSQIYKYIHKQHHEWTASISWVGVYSHPVEHVLSNLVPIFTGILICGSHVATSMKILSIKYSCN
jgi:sterol desaturase/sphingolipid hydroxylase (fatty acid hydroxylase superfamily)